MTADISTQNAVAVSSSAVASSAIFKEKHHIIDIETVPQNISYQTVSNTQKYEDLYDIKLELGI
jgi:hypothetical protein